MLQRKEQPHPPIGLGIDAGDGGVKPKPGPEVRQIDAGAIQQAIISPLGQGLGPQASERVPLRA
jgi:hypothetical protein